MFYYKFTATTPYIGTDNDFYVKSETPLTHKEIDYMCEEYNRQNAESFEYMECNQFCEEEYDTFEDYKADVEDNVENYYMNCECDWEEIDEEEYNENN